MCFPCKETRMKPTSDVIIDISNNPDENSQSNNKEKTELLPTKKDKALKISKNILSNSSRSYHSQNNSAKNLPSFKDNQNDNFELTKVIEKRKSIKDSNMFKSKFLALNN